MFHFPLLFSIHHTTVQISTTMTLYVHNWRLALDSDHDGVLSREDLRKSYPDEPTLDEVMKALDPQNNGYVT